MREPEEQASSGVIHNRDKVTITGSIPVQSVSGETEVQFRIEGEIDRAAVRANTGRRSGATDYTPRLNTFAARDRSTAEVDRLSSALR